MNSLAARLFLSCTLAAITFNTAMAGEGWVKLTDGKTFDGWKINENPSSWSMEDGAFVAQGERSHLFYVGDDKPFVNFEFRCKVMTRKNANGGIYFHTKYQDSGWPKGGYEAQVNNTQSDPKRTGSLYAVENVYEAPAKDDEWFDYHIKVVGKRITITVNGKQCVDFVEEPDRKPGEHFDRALSEGTFALQAHDPGSKVYFKDIEVKRLP